MSHYEQRLERDATQIRAVVVEVGERIETALKHAAVALLTANHKLAYEVVLGDLAVNRMIREQDRRCHGFVARHLPSAGHLRFVSSVLRLNVALERIGDYAVTVSRETVQLSTTPPPSVARDIELLADQTRMMFHQAMQSFNGANAELARGTMGMAAQVERSFENVFQDLLQAGEQGRHPLRDMFGTLIVFNRLGRVGDQAKNICEETIFAVTGQTKAPKVYNILFVDGANDLQSQMAEAYARKAFPGSGVYSSAGWRPAPRLEPEFIGFMDEQGFDLRGAGPRRLETVHDLLEEHHVIVSLEGDARPHIGQIPFRTVLLEWNVGDVPRDRGPAATRQALQEMSHKISGELQKLMETLRGEGAD